MCLTEVKDNSTGPHFGHNPMPQKKDYDPLIWEGKKQYHDKRTKNLYTPEESPQAPLYTENNVSFDKGTQFKRDKNVIILLSLDLTK